MPPPTDKQLSEAVGVFLEDADFETVTSKGIRKALEAKYGMKLRDRKDFIQEAALAAMRRIEREREEGSDSSDEDAPIASVKYKKHAKKKSSTAEVTTFEENGVHACTSIKHVRFCHGLRCPIGHTPIRRGRGGKYDKC